MEEDNNHRPHHHTSSLPVDPSDSSPSHFSASTPSSSSSLPSSRTAAAPSLLLSTVLSGAKVQFVLSFLRRLRAECPHDKVVIFSQFTRMLDVLEVALPTVDGVGPAGFTRFDGSMTADAQHVALRAFQQQPPASLSVLLISLQAGGVGLSLTAANHCVMVDSWWNPAIQGQAYDRIHRLSQRKDVHIHQLSISDTVEQRLQRVQTMKGALAREALQDEDLEEKVEEGEEEAVEEVDEDEAEHQPRKASGDSAASVKRRRQPVLSLEALQRLFDTNESDEP